MVIEIASVPGLVGETARVQGLNPELCVLFKMNVQLRPLCHSGPMRSANSMILVALPVVALWATSASAVDFSFDGYAMRGSSCHPVKKAGSMAD